MSQTKPNHGPGFLFGVTLGAIVGAGALIFSGKDTEQIRDKIKSGLDDSLDKIKHKYPEESSKVQDILEQALQDARQKSHKLSSVLPSTPTPKKSSKTSKSKPANVRSFTRSGKPLVSDS